VVAAVLENWPKRRLPMLGRMNYDTVNLIELQQ
jgi:hypothetical protein